MIYKYNLRGLPPKQLEGINGILPPNFSIKEENGQFFLSVDFPDSETNEEVYTAVRQEFDRIHAITGEDIVFDMISKDNSGGIVFKTNELSFLVRGTESVPSDVDLQNWNDPRMSNIFRLWRDANSQDQIDVKIPVLFKIIEANYPATNDNTVYPKYTQVMAINNEAPDPRTESKLLRDLVSHQKGTPNSSQLKAYCKFLDIPVAFYEPTNQEVTRKITSRFPIIENEAGQIVDSLITKNDQQQE